MSTSSAWLDRLTQATNYRQLQDIFSEILVQSKVAIDEGNLIDAIDEAVRRLEQERARDEAELKDIQGRYDTFQQAHKGVVGWFKRHIPFTETRRQETEHREQVADQNAEILADNLVIARAQMIKERMLPPESRKLGLRPHDWKTRLESSARVPALATYAESLRHLAAECEQSQGFVQELKHDIDAFAGAHFSDKLDRERRDADVSTARDEMSPLSQEITDELALKKHGLDRLASLVAGELTIGDPQFRGDQQRFERLQSARRRIEPAHAATTRLESAASAIARLITEANGLPDRIRQLTEADRTAQARREEHSLANARLDAVAKDRQANYEEAKRSLENKQQVLEGASQMYEAYQNESAGAQAAASAVGKTVYSPIVDQFNKARAAVDAARIALTASTGPCETAKKEAADAQAAFNRLDAEIADRRRQIAELEERSRRISLEISAARDRLRVEFNTAAGALSECLDLVQTLENLPPYRLHELAGGSPGWLGTRGLEQSLCTALVEADRNPAFHAQASLVLGRISKWQASQVQTLDRDSGELRSRLEAAWKRRCRELVGDALADLACASGLPESPSV